MALGPVTGGILNDISNLHNDASDIRDFYKELKQAPKRHNGRKVAYSPRFARQHFKKAPGKRQPQAGKQRHIAKVPGKQVTSRLKPPAQAGKKRQSSPLPKEPPRALLELQHQNKARAAGPAGLPPSDKPGKNELFNDLMSICKEIKTPKTAVEFKRTLNSLSVKGLDGPEVHRLQSMLVYKLKQMAVDPKVSDQLTPNLLKGLAGHSAAADILKVKNDAAHEALEQRRINLRGPIPSSDEIQRRLDDLRRS